MLDYLLNQTKLSQGFHIKLLYTLGVCSLLYTEGLIAKNHENLEVLHLNQTMVISQANRTITNKHFICNGTGFEALRVNASNIVIENNLFENCDTAINMARAEHTKITKNRFEKVGAGIIFTNHSNDTIVEYNEFSRIGERDCTRATGGKNCNVFGSRENTTNATFSHNLIDNSGTQSRYMEDYIGLFTRDRINSNINIEDNLIIGSSEQGSSSFSGACIVVDGVGSNYTIRKNSCYNVSGYGIATAGGSNVKVEENRVYMDQRHHDSIRRAASGRSHAFAYGITNFANRGCGSNIQFLHNEGYAYHDGYGGKVKSAWMPCLNSGDHNSYPDGSYANNIVLRGNDFKASDPHWSIPNNIFSNLGRNYFSGTRAAVVNNTPVVNEPVAPKSEEVVTPPTNTSPANTNEQISLSSWSGFGETYGHQNRIYRGDTYVYASPKTTGSGIYKVLSTKAGQTYEVSATLIGSDTNRKERFNGFSYLTVSSERPTKNSQYSIAESERVEGGTEIQVTFTFVAQSSQSYLALRSDSAWHYASAKKISVKGL